MALMRDRITISRTTANVGPYDFRNAENVDGIAESIHKPRIYCITRNVMEFAKFWMDKSKVGQYT